MREEERLTSAEAEFEATLRGLQPAGASINRDQMMYRAGYAAGNRHSRVWQGATLLMAAAFAASLVMQNLVSGPATSRQMAAGPSSTRVIIPDAESTHSGTQYAAGSHSYIALRNEVLTKGLAALPVPRAGSTSDDPPLTVESLLGRGS